MTSSLYVPSPVPQRLDWSGTPSRSFPSWQDRSQATLAEHVLGATALDSFRRKVPEPTAICPHFVSTVLKRGPRQTMLIQPAACQ